jgi:hypothetical protein
MRLVQILGENVEELWYFPDEISNDQLKSWYEEYEENTFDHNEESFEDFMENKYSEIECNRVFVDEIYV